MIPSAVETAEAVVPWWQAGALSLVAVVVGAWANHLGNRSTQERLLNAQRDDRLRLVLANLLTHGQYVTDQFMTLGPALAYFSEEDWTEWSDTEGAQAISDARKALQQEAAEAWLLCPAGPLRDALAAYRSAESDPERQPRGLMPKERERLGLTRDQAIESIFAVYGERRRLLTLLETEAVAHFSQSKRAKALTTIRTRRRL